MNYKKDIDTINNIDIENNINDLFFPLNEQSQLKLLCDEIFGEENFINNISIKMSEATGVKMAHINKRLPKLKESLLFYKKNNIEISDVRIPKEKWDDEYKTLVEGVSKGELEI